MRAQILILGLLLAAWPVAQARQLKQGLLGGSCGTVNPDEFCTCCSNKGGSDSDDTSCADNYAEKCLDGGLCSTVTPDDFCACCDNKGGKNGDSSCTAQYAKKCKQVGTTCSTVNPDDFCQCCDDKGGANGDKDCQASYAKKCAPTPPSPAPGSSCATVTPGQNCACCKDKNSDDRKADPWCQDNYSSKCLVGSSCGTVTPGQNCACCAGKSSADKKKDPWCSANYASNCNPVIGGSCATVTPGQNCACCKDKNSDDRNADAWCQDNYSSKCLMGSSCGTVTPGQNCACCSSKDNSERADDPWCSEHYKSQCLVGSSCGTVTPSDRCKCCAQKGNAMSKDKYCADNYQNDCAAPPNNSKDFPYMAYIESPLGSCGGALVAPGYVLTAAQCVMFNGTVQDAAEVDVWVGGKWMTVEAVLANNSTAVMDEGNEKALIGFADFEDVDMGELSGDVAMLALKQNSSAQPIALPTADVPLAGNTTNQTAWQTPEEFVVSANITVNETCNSGFNGTFCAEEEPAELQPLCPGDKGSPATMKLNGTLTQVGITSGDGCEGTSFVKLSEPTTLAQIVVWLESRIATNNSGLNDANLAWIATAKEYIFNSTAGEIEL